MNKKTKPLAIFKPGRHVSNAGDELVFTEADVAATAAAYDPALHKAPLVIGHPKTDAPAYGWTQTVQFADGLLQALPEAVNAEFAQWVNSGLWNKISASFYPPASKANPVPGVYYLRHIGFLGGHPPAIKGLPEPSFADSDDCITLEFAAGEHGAVEFGEWDDVQNASLWRNLREFFIGKFGQDEADKTIPGYAVQQLEQAANDELREAAENDNAGGDVSPGFHESQSNPGNDMSDEDKARLAELEAENARLTKQQADFAEQQKQAKTKTDHASHLAFAEGLVSAGQLLPPQKELAVAVLDYMAGQEQVIEFGEGDGKKPLIEAFKTEFLSKLPKQIEFGELGNGQGADAVNFADPNALAAAATRYQAAQAATGITVSDIDAIQHVRGTHV